MNIKSSIDVYFVVVGKRVFVCEETNAPEVEIQITVKDAVRRLNCSPFPAPVCCQNCAWASSCGSARVKAVPRVVPAI